MELLNERMEKEVPIFLVTHSTHCAENSRQIYGLFDCHVVSENIKRKFHVQGSIQERENDISPVRFPSGIRK
jgi:hypothetical protein